MRILLADDHPLFRSGMRYLLSDLAPDIEIVEAGSGEEANAALERTDFDLVLIDLVMPGMGRQTGIAALKATRSDVPIVVISMLDTPADIREAVSAGAAGFIPKCSRPEVMVEAIKLVLSGGVYLPPSILEEARNDVREEDREAKAALTKRLSRRQTTVLAELAQGKSNKEIANALSLSEATVKVHIAAIMRALKVQNRTQVVLTAVRLGLVPPPSAWPEKGGEPSRPAVAGAAANRLVTNHP